MSTGRMYTVDLGAYRPDDRESEAEAGATVDALIAPLVRSSSCVAVRALSMHDHPTMSSAELADVILRLGTDRYDPARTSVLADFYDSWGVDLHAITCWVGADGMLASYHYPDSTVTAGLIRDFRQGPPVDRGSVPLRVDLLTVYDRSALEPVPVAYAEGVEDDPTAFRFRSPERAATAVVGVVLLAYHQ